MCWWGWPPGGCCLCAQSQCPYSPSCRECLPLWSKGPHIVSCWSEGTGSTPRNHSVIPLNIVTNLYVWSKCSSTPFLHEIWIHINLGALHYGDHYQLSWFIPRGQVRLYTLADNYGWWLTDYIFLSLWKTTI